MPHFMINDLACEFNHTHSTTNTYACAHIMLVSHTRALQTPQITKTDRHTWQMELGVREMQCLSHVTDLQYVAGMCKFSVWVCLCDGTDGYVGSLIALSSTLHGDAQNVQIPWIYLKGCRNDKAGRRVRERCSGFLSFNFQKYSVQLTVS